VRAAGFFTEPVETLVHRLFIQTLVLLGPEYLGEEVRHQATQVQVGVGDGQDAAVALADGSRSRARTLRAHLEQAALQTQNGSASCSHRDYLQLFAHKRLPIYQVFEHVLVLPLPLVDRYISGRATHVEPNDFLFGSVILTYVTLETLHHAYVPPSGAGE